MESIETINENDFFEFYNSRTYTANCFNDDGSLNKNYNSFKTTGVIASIFEDHWLLLIQIIKILLIVVALMLLKKFNSGF